MTYLQTSSHEVRCSLNTLGYPLERLPVNTSHHTRTDRVLPSSEVPQGLQGLWAPLPRMAAFTLLATGRWHFSGPSTSEVS